MWHDVALPPETVALRKEVRRAAEERVAPYARESVKPPELVALTSYFSVELPGIEPIPEIPLSWGNAEFRYAKRRESTRNDLRIRRRC
jgi:hypothetical protein